MIKALSIVSDGYLNKCGRKALSIAVAGYLSLGVCGSSTPVSVEKDYSYQAPAPDGGGYSDNFVDYPLQEAIKESEKIKKDDEEILVILKAALTIMNS